MSARAARSPRTSPRVPPAAGSSPPGPRTGSPAASVCPRTSPGIPLPRARVQPVPGQARWRLPRVPGPLRAFRCRELEPSRPQD
eukprot:8207510-Alexandrium_andersonii.AAC.1